MPPAAGAQYQAGDTHNEAAAWGSKRYTWALALRASPRREPAVRCRHAAVAAAAEDSLHGPAAARDRIFLHRGSRYWCMHAHSNNTTLPPPNDFTVVAIHYLLHAGESLCP